MKYKKQKRIIEDKNKEKIVIEKKHHNNEEKESFKKKIFYLFTNFKILLLLFFLVFSFFSINYDFFREEGIVISSVSFNSLAFNKDIEVNSITKLRNLEEIKSVDNKKILFVEDFRNYVNSKQSGDKIRVQTDKNNYEFIFDFNENETAYQNLGIEVIQKQKSNIKLGIELTGGSRIILKPKSSLSDEDFEILLKIVETRISRGGLSSFKISKIDDAFSSDKFILIETSSTNKNKVEELLKRAGKFEAKIGNKIAFSGEDVLRVLDSNFHSEGCSNQGAGYICSSAFQVEITEKAAQNFLDVTSKLNVVGQSLEKPIEFFLDDKKTDELSISSVFKHRKITNPQITVSGENEDSREQAIKSVNKEVSFLKAVLGVKALPSELEVISSYSISKNIGNNFLQNAIVIGLLALLAVSILIALRYNNPKIFVGIFIVLISEIVIIFGIASFLPWLITFDLVAIGGLIAAIGTGVDDQIIITDEYFRKQNKKEKSKKRLKKAIAIIFISFITTVFAMFPLYFAGLELIKGFATMVILSVSIGVLITRPAYANFLRILQTTKKQRDEEEF